MNVLKAGQHITSKPFNLFFMTEVESWNLYGIYLMFVYAIQVKNYIRIYTVTTYT